MARRERYARLMGISYGTGKLRPDEEIIARLRGRVLPPGAVAAGPTERRESPERDVESDAQRSKQ